MISFYSTVFLSALHVSNESSRSSSGVRRNILYYIVWYNRYNRAGESSCFEVVGKNDSYLYRTVEYSTLFCVPDDERLDPFETCRADKKTVE